MEFFDFTGITNEEEKAQALDIITHHESSGVEFFLNYNNSTIHENNNYNNHHNTIEYPKSNNTYIHENGELRSPPFSSSQNSSNHNTTTNNHHHYTNHNHHSQIHSNGLIENSQFVNHSQNPLNNEWETTSNHGSTPPNSNVLVTNMANAGAAPGHPPAPHPPPYLFGAATHPAYFAAHHGPPPNHPYAIHALPPPPLGPAQVHPTATAVNQHQSKICMQNIAVVSSSSSTNIKNSSKSSSTNNVNNSSNCDIHMSTTAIYMPPSQYSDTPPQIMDNQQQHLKNSSVSGDQGGSNIMSDSSTLVSNGSVAAVQHHLGPYPSPYAFHHPQTHALPFPPHPGHPHPHAHPHFTHHQPIYYVPHDGFIQYTPFSPSNQPQPTHISSMSAAAAAAAAVSHHIITTSSSSPLDIVSSNSSSNQQQSSSSSLSAPAPSTAAATAVTTLSNLSSSSMSASSVSSIPSASTAGAYHSSLQSSVSDTQVFEISSNENHVHESLSHQQQNRSNNFVSDDKVSSSSQVPSQSTTQQDAVASVSESNNSDLAATETSDTSTKQVSEYLKLCLNISDANKQDKEDMVTSKNNIQLQDSSKINSAQIITTTNNTEANSQQNSESNVSSSSETNDKTTTSYPSLKPTTWASKLFPTTTTNNTISANNIENNNHQASILNIKSGEDLKVISSDTITGIGSEVKLSSNLQNGEFPELNANVKINLHPHSMVNHHNSNRRGGRPTNNHDDDNLKKLSIIPMKNDPIAFKLAKRLRDSIHLKHSLPTIMPCGLINRGNWCYVNATLQALLACPPFYNLMREISETSGIFRQSTSTPIIDNFARYFSKFLPSDYKRQMKSASNPYLEELLNSEPFEPTFIYDTLKYCGMIKNDAQRGHQEDAEEFLSSVLNGLNEEMIQLSKLLNESNEKKLSGGKTNGFGLGDESINTAFDLGKDHFGPCRDVEDDSVQDSSNDIWHEVGTSKHKSLPTRSAKIISTSITEIFGGSTLDIRTVNKDKDSCGNRQPFFTLQLDIKPSSIKTLDDAIRWQTKSETIHGYTCSKTKQVVDASSQMFLENLPPILILHLKLFDYEIETGASKKLLKTIDFPENFEIPRECVTGKIDSRCRRYKLLAVVYHNGSEVINGHYITDVYHLGLNQWLRCDDSNIKVISLTKVLTGNERQGNLVPYLLFYRRYDTLHSSNNNSSVSSSSSNANNANNNSNIQQINSGSKRSSTNNQNTEFGHNQNHHHYHSHHHHYDQQQHNHDTMLMSNKFSSISRHF